MTQHPKSKITTAYLLQAKQCVFPTPTRFKVNSQKMNRLRMRSPNTTSCKFDINSFVNI